MSNNTNTNCDYCKHYNWYYDYCDKWKCEIDARSIYDCFEQNNDTIITNSDIENKKKGYN